MKVLIYSLLLSGATLASMAAPPAGYYNALAGKSGSALKAALKQICLPSDFSTPTYNTKTWPAFEKTDVRQLDGREIWWDMYSNLIVYTDSHASMNIEHSVANSWWGGVKGNAYNDLMHLNPSDMGANGQKSNLPLGIVATASYDNGLVKVGTPASGTAGGAAKVFEPADEYKGDFARAYFYMFTAYDDISWTADGAMYTSAGQLQPWAAQMLLEWAAADPVDSKEINRNEAIYEIQHNRNPYIDHPELADYIFGSLSSTAYSLRPEAEATDRPAAPVFTDHWMTGVNTYHGRWWEEKTIAIDSGDADLWVSINGGEYQRFGPGVTVPSAATHRQIHSLAAYTETATRAAALRSPISYLTLTSKDPDADDYCDAIWTPVSSLSAIQTGKYYIITSASNDHIMGYEGGTTATKYLPDVGFVRKTDGNVTELPVSAAIVKFVNAGSGKYYVEVCDPTTLSKGYWTMASSGNNMSLKTGQGTPADIAFNTDGSVEIDFGGKSLKYNPQNVRFTNYGSNSSTAGPIRLSQFDAFPVITGVDEIEVEDEIPVGVAGNRVILPAGWHLYGLAGLQMNPEYLPAGIYIAVSPTGKSVKLIIP